MDIPKIYQHYPAVPLSDLSDLYSVGNNLLGTARAAIVSQLPKVLRIGIEDEQVLINRYTLFLENTPSVDSIQWSVAIYIAGIKYANDELISITLENDDTNTLTAFYDAGLFLTDDRPQAERLVISCTVKNGGDTLTLEIEHLLVKMLDYDEIAKTGFGEWWHALLHITNRPTTNYLFNCINDYLTNPGFTWNGTSIATDDNERAGLMKTITGILYYFILKNSDAKDNKYNIIQLPQFDNQHITSFLNDTTDKITYDGGYRNGMTQLPLYLLNDIFSDVTKLPDFGTISDTDLLYAILKNNTLVNKKNIEDNDDNLPTNLNTGVIDAKKRLHDAEDKLTQWYWLSLFPKSGIKLTAILLKYLLACSKKNNFADCHEPKPAWAGYGFATDLKDIQSLLVCLLTHYFNGPSGKMTDTGKLAFSICNQHTTSSHIAFILSNTPRILTAYFAKKRVIKKDNGELVCFFERIDSSQQRVDDDGRELDVQPYFDSVMGRQVYLVVETLNCRKRELLVNVLSADDDTGGRFRHFADPYTNLELVTGPTQWAADTNPVYGIGTDFILTVGDTSALTNMTNTVDDYINVHDDSTAHSYHVDHIDKAILKLNIRPGIDTLFNEWTATLGETPGGLVIKAQPRFTTEYYLGNRSKLIASSEAGEFLNSNDPWNKDAIFRLVNRRVYEIFLQENTFNPLRLSNDGTHRKLVGHVDNQDHNNKIVYYLRDALDNEHDIFYRLSGEQDLFNILGKDTGRFVGGYRAGSDPYTLVDYTPYNASGVDVHYSRIYADETVISYGRKSVHGAYQMVYLQYAPLTDQVDMVPLPEAGYDYQRGDVKIRFSFVETRRLSTNPDVYAGFLGAIAQTGYELVSVGSSFADGSSFPSQEHNNGNAIDTKYFKSGGTVLVAENEAFIEAMKNFGFHKRIIGSDTDFDALARTGEHTSRNADHDSHLHCGEFNLSDGTDASPYVSDVFELI